VSSCRRSPVHSDRVAGRGSLHSTDCLRQCRQSAALRAPSAAIGRCRCALPRRQPSSPALRSSPVRSARRRILRQSVSDLGCSRASMGARLAQVQHAAVEARTPSTRTGAGAPRRRAAIPARNKQAGLQVSLATAQTGCAAQGCQKRLSCQNWAPAETAGRRGQRAAIISRLRPMAREQQLAHWRRQSVNEIAAAATRIEWTGLRRQCSRNGTRSRRLPAPSPDSLLDAAPRPPCSPGLCSVTRLKARRPSNVSVTLAISRLATPRVDFRVFPQN